MSPHEQKIKELIISSLQLEEMKPEDIETDMPLFGEGLGLDSIDALELGVALQKAFGIKFSSSSEENSKHFYSVKTIAALIDAQGK